GRKSRWASAAFSFLRSRQDLSDWRAAKSWSRSANTSCRMERTSSSPSLGDVLGLWHKGRRRAISRSPSLPHFASYICAIRLRRRALEHCGVALVAGDLAVEVLEVVSLRGRHAELFDLEGAGVAQDLAFDFG